MRFFITGTAGFIGFHLARRLLSDGHEVHGYDGLTPYYDVSLKEARLGVLTQQSGYRNTAGLLEDAPALSAAAERASPDVIVHLAAQAGVRYSIENPAAYASSNLTGTFNVLEVARERRPQHLLIASTSSVYGGNTRMPFAETDLTDAPLTLYAATKKAAEAMSHSYAHLWSIPTTCFRFFTVYGPWGRPDMALFKFARAITAGEPIEVYGEGRMQRDFTYIDDLVEAVTRLIGHAPRQGEPLTGPGVVDSLSPVAPWRVVNIAGGEPVELLSFIENLEHALGRKAEKRMRPMQPGDVARTHADPSLLSALVGPLEWTPTPAGVAAFVDWYREWASRSP